jgi:hypothetical protein
MNTFSELANQSVCAQLNVLLEFGLLLIGQFGSFFNPPHMGFAQQLVMGTLEMFLFCNEKRFTYMRDKRL